MHNMSQTVEPIRKKKDIEKMKKALHGRDRVMFIFGINSGLRISDIIELKIEDVFESNGKPKDGIAIQEQKTSKPKYFAFNKAIKDALKDVDTSDRKAPLFPSRKGSSNIGRGQAWKIIKDAAERAGLKENLGTHTLRKTFGYHAYKAGVDLSLLQTIFNHSSQGVTLKYIGITQDKINDVYNAINL
jgi:integrase